MTSSSVIQTSLRLCLVLMVLSACQIVNNPFNGTPDARIHKVSGAKPGSYIGLRQIRDLGNPVRYDYNEPRVSLEGPSPNRPITFLSYTAVIHLSDGTVLPAQTYFMLPVKISQKPVDMLIPILAPHHSLLKTVYPEDRSPTSAEGRAEVIMTGKDINANSYELPLTIPLVFQGPSSP